MLKNWRPFLFGLFAGLLSVALILLLSKRQTGTPIKLAPPLPTPTPPPLRVHVTGAVKSPGVYELPIGSIAQDAINAAGGLTESASTERLNLAEILGDGDQIFVPEAAAVSALPPEGTPAASGQPSSGGLININTAAQAELETLPRIGPAIAQRIIEYRTQYGLFARIEDIKNVKGIGDSIFEAIKDYITVK